MTASQALFTAVSQAAATTNRISGAPGSFTRALNASANLITFNGSFQLTAAANSAGTGTILTPVPFFSTTGSIDTNLFNAIIDNLTNPVNPSEKTFKLTGNITSDGKGHLVLTYNGQLPFTEVESADGLTTARTVPPYFASDVPATTTTGTTTTGTTTTTSARTVTFQTATGATTVSTSASPVVNITVAGTGLTPGTGTLELFNNGVASIGPATITIPSNGTYSFSSYNSSQFAVGTWTAKITDTTGAVTSNNFVVTA
jgi:hypothetical protein